LNSQPDDKDCEECKKCCGLAVYVIAVLGAFLIVAALVGLMRHYTRPEPLGQDRAAARKKALAELRASNADVLDNPNYVWQDKTKGIVRLPIVRAMDLALQLWQNPAAARTNLTARVEKATAVPPPQSFE
jgi:hypothetical protein